GGLIGIAATPPPEQEARRRYPQLQPPPPYNQWEDNAWERVWPFPVAVFSDEWLTWRGLDELFRALAWLRDPSGGPFQAQTSEQVPLIWSAENWEACRDAEAMLQRLSAFKPAERKWRLFACACARDSDRLMADEANARLVEAAEEFFDTG